MATLLNNLRCVGNIHVEGDSVIQGNLVVQGTTTQVDTENVLVEDAHMYVNSNYVTSGAPVTGGLVVNYNPLAVTTTIAAGGIVEGTGAGHTINVASEAGFSANDLIQITDADNVNNNGLYEILGTSPGVITAKEVTTEDFTQDSMNTDPTVAGNITKVTVSVIRSGTDGVWEVGAGSSSGIVFTDLATTGAIITAHSGLTGLGADDHTQYVLLLGRSGGQDIIGGTAASDSLTLESTSNGTKGTIDLLDPTRVDDLDTLTATTLALGKATATKVEIADTGVVTEALGNFNVLGDYQTKGTSGVISRTGLGGANCHIISENPDADFAGLTGSNNIILGNDCGISIGSAFNNMCIGTLAANSLVSGIYNVIIGTNAGQEMTTGSCNVAIGDWAGREITSGNFNMALGANSCGAFSFSTTTGDSNTAIGDRAMSDLSTGDNNVAIGRNCLDTLTTGIRNFAIGGNANITNSSGSYRGGIGYNVDLDVDHQFTLGSSTLSETFTCLKPGITSVADMGSGLRQWRDGYFSGYSKAAGLYVNSQYTSTTAIDSGGIVVNYDPTATATTVAGSFTNAANSTVVTTGSATFATTDIIAVTGTHSNDGFYEVLSHVGTTLTIDGTPNESFLQTSFDDDTAGLGAIRKINVSVIRVGTDGVWETGAGSTTVITFTDIAGTNADHGLLSGLGDDDHTQYTLLAGRAGGQDIIGGTGVSDSLTLESTSNGTKGTIDLLDPTRVDDIDALTATTLALGKATATKVEIGASDILSEALGDLKSQRYLLGLDLSLIPVAGGQSVVTSWYGLQLTGNRQVSVDYTPIDYGFRTDYGVLVPCQQSDKIAFMIRGDTGQTADLSVWENSAGTTLAAVTAAGLFETDGLDSHTATTLSIGAATATKVEIADTGVITEIQGNVDVLGDYYHSGDVGVITLTGLGGSNNYVTSTSAYGAIAAGATDNILIGTGAGTSITTGDANVCIGTNTGTALVTASNNIFIGDDAGDSATGAQNIAIGGSTFGGAGSGSNNVAIGHTALTGNASAEDNVAIGYRSLFAVNSAAADGNTAVGSRAGELITSASLNTLIGHQAGNVVTTGTGNVCIGYNANVTTGTQANQIAIGQGATTTAADSCVIGNSSITVIRAGGDRTCDLGSAAQYFKTLYIENVVEGVKSYTGAGAHVLATDGERVNKVSHTGAASVTLPTAPTEGTKYTIININTGAVTINRGGSDTINDGSSTSFSLASQYDRATFQYVGTIWFTV